MKQKDMARFRPKYRINNETECWDWVAGKNNMGYGVFSLKGKLRLAHRVLFEDAHGPIPDGLVLDHLCRNSICINPAHLEVVTQGENVRRGLWPTICGENNRRKTHCPQGHPYSGANLYLRTDGARVCRACQRVASLASYHRRKAHQCESHS